MENKQHWRGVLIFVLVVLAALALWPPQSKLKPGLDLAGGAALTYGVDTEGMSDAESKGLAAKVIPVIKKRIDPDGLSNIVIRPQGDTRFEIQLPLASQETRQLRDSYQAAYQALEDMNINLAVVIRALSEPQADRTAKFDSFAKSEAHRELLTTLASAFDERQELRAKRDAVNASVKAVEAKMEAIGLNVRSVEYRYDAWSTKTAEELDKELTDFAKRADEKDLDAKVALLKEYISGKKEYAKVVDKLAGEVSESYNQAIGRLSELNINIETLVEMMGTASKDEYLTKLTENFPDRAEQLKNFATTYQAYAGVRGRLDDPEDVKRMLKGAGVLEFRILPSVAAGDLTTDQAKAYVQSLETKGPKLASDSSYVWCEVEDANGRGFPGSVAGTFAEKIYILASNQDGETMLNIPGGKKWKLAKARRDSDQSGRRAIGFEMNEIGANMFYELTDANMKRQLCVLLDNKAISAATIQSAIGKRGIITGDYSQLEQDDMVNKLNAGSLPARISEAPISEKTIGATIGEDNRDKGIIAGFIGLGIVVIFMVFYYSIGGAIADIALSLNMLFILGVMAFCGATFTLPGIAGLILTIGMAVDANVLIFERVREEQESGVSLKTALRLGYEKAFSTIFDANLTTFITAFILYRVASEEIKGFAIVLMIGIVSSMFTALFVTRTFFDWLVEAGKLKGKIVMAKIIGKPNVDWISMRGVFFTISSILVVLGLLNFFTRGVDKYDIEFTGGTSVQVNFKEGVSLERDQVEQMITDAGLKAAKVYSVGDTNMSYEINTTETNKSTVDVTFTGAILDVAGVQQVLEVVAGDLVKNVEVVKTDAGFAVSTSQLSESEMRKLINKAFKGKELTIGDMKVDETVNNVVLAAFGDMLERQVALGLTAQAPALITEKVADSNPAMLNYIGGICIDCNTLVPSTASQIEARVNDLRFKPDMQELAWFKFFILDKNGDVLEEGKAVNEFKYVALHPDAGSRKLSDDEIARFQDNELTKIKAAAAIETSLPRVTQVNPSIGSESQTKAIVAIVLSLLSIIGYVWIRFGNLAFGLAAIVALVHDVCITLGLVTVCVYIAGKPLGDMLGIRDFKINLEMIAAFLTIIGYSLNDTIVVFDRIRENRGQNADIKAELLNESINQTLSRTLLTSLTTFIVVLVMYIWGGIGLRGFTFAMLVGIIVGTYSSIAIASPVLLIGSGVDKLKKNKK